MRQKPIQKPGRMQHEIRPAMHRCQHGHGPLPSSPAHRAAISKSGEIPRTPQRQLQPPRQLPDNLRFRSQAPGVPKVGRAQTAAHIRLQEVAKDPPTGATSSPLQLGQRAIRPWFVMPSDCTIPPALVTWPHRAAKDERHNVTAAARPAHRPARPRHRGHPRPRDEFTLTLPRMTQLLIHKIRPNNRMRHISMHCPRIRSLCGDISTP